MPKPTRELVREVEQKFRGTSLGPLAKVFGQALDALEEVQWAGNRYTDDEPVCPSCAQTEAEGHNDWPYCKIGRLLA